MTQEELKEEGNKVAIFVGVFILSTAIVMILFISSFYIQNVIYKIIGISSFILFCIVGLISSFIFIEKLNTPKLNSNKSHTNEIIETKGNGLIIKEKYNEKGKIISKEIYKDPQYKSEEMIENNEINWIEVVAIGGLVLGVILIIAVIIFTLKIYHII